MKINEVFYAAVWKESGEIVGHPEGYIISEERRTVQSELKCWKEVIGLNKMSDVEIKKLRMIEE